MSFFDNLGKKVSEAGQKTIQKTKELTDISRLNSMITDEEKAINNNFLQIGKLYTDSHREESEKAYTGMINAVIESEQKIEDYKKQIQGIKGTKHCEKCGAEVPKCDVFCSACGTKLSESQIMCVNDIVDADIDVDVDVDIDTDVDVDINVEVDVEAKLEEEN